MRRRGLATRAPGKITSQNPTSQYWNGTSWQAGATTVSATSLAAGTWNWTAPALTTNGTYNGTVKATDRSGNNTSANLPFVFDNTSPNTNTITTPGANAYYGNAPAVPAAWGGSSADGTAGFANAAAVQITFQNPSSQYWNGASW